MVPFSVAILLVALASFHPSAGGDISAKCPDVDVTGNPVFIAHEFDCTKYYACENGKKLVSRCSDGRLFFNRVNQMCNWAGSVDCPDAYRTPIKLTLGQRDAGIPTDECPVPDPMTHSNYLPHETDCHKFYECSNGRKYLFTCPSDLVWNTDLNTCDWPWNWPCSGGGSSSQKPPTGAPAAVGTPPTGAPAAVGSAPTGAPAAVGTPPTGAPVVVGTAPTGAPAAVGSAPTGAPAAVGTPPTGAPVVVGTAPTGSPVVVGTAPTGAPAAVGSAPTGSPVAVGTPPTGSPIAVGTPPTGSPATVGPTKPPTAECREKRHYGTGPDLMKHECDCGLYYRCEDGEWIREECPDGLYFNEDDQKCVIWSEAECNKSDESDTDEDGGDGGDHGHDLKKLL